jgi:hypothetical protein
MHVPTAEAVSFRVGRWPTATVIDRFLLRPERTVPVLGSRHQCRAKRDLHAARPHPIGHGTVESVDLGPFAAVEVAEQRRPIAADGAGDRDYRIGRVWHGNAVNGGNGGASSATALATRSRFGTSVTPPFSTPARAISPLMAVLVASFR